MATKDMKETEVYDNGENEEFFKHVRMNRWLSVDFMGKRFLRLNWVVSLAASIILWGFAIACLIEPDDILFEFKEWQTWITQNFTWFYIGTQDVWMIFLLWVCFSKFGKLKLGKDDEKPEYSDFTWFAMLFSSGIAVGFYYWGVSEPIYYYRSVANNQIKPGFQNDDQRAQQAIFLLFFHWGVHAWVVYILVALVMGFVAYRWNLPMTARMAFYPLVGNLVYGGLGDTIDALSMACTTFGVCTSLGFGVASINAGLHYLNNDIPADDTAWQVALIWTITPVATLSVLSGVKSGIKTISEICFSMGCFLLGMLLYMDNTWFLLNSYVQSVGFYFQWVIQVGFETDSWQQLNLEFQNGTVTDDHGNSRTTNMLFGSGHTQMIDKVANAFEKANSTASAEDRMGRYKEFYGSHSEHWIDWWTIFYWGWWISWAPFVGIFIAKISRGRTIRQVITGALFAPTFYSFFFLNTLGALGIKMQRTAELALSPDASAVDYETGFANCTALGYVDGEPFRADAVALAEEGFYALSCRPHTGRIYDIMYKRYGVDMGTFMVLFTVINLIIYFITSSDSGSWVDDSLSSNGLENPPIIQKVYWCCTEGALASALLVAGGTDALSALQAASICAGFPYTIAISFICQSLYRACKIDEAKMEGIDKPDVPNDIMTQKMFHTRMLDFFEGFTRYGQPEGLPSPMQRLKNVTIATFFPFKALMKICRETYGPSGIKHAIAYSVCFYTWLVLMFVEMGVEDIGMIGWCLYITFVAGVVLLRMKMRAAENIYGGSLEDTMCCLILFPFALDQMENQIDCKEMVSEFQVPLHLRDEKPDNYKSLLSADNPLTAC